MVILVLVASSCAQVPKESVELSATVGEDGESAFGFC